MSTDAIIEVKGITFVPATAPNLEFSTAEFFLKDTASDSVAYKHKTFWVKKKVKLIFYFSDFIYTPLSLWFLQTAGSGDPDGKKTFINVKTGEYEKDGIKYPAVEVKDDFGGPGLVWKILIPIMKIPYGPAGLIDPEIGNTSEFPPLR